MSKERNEEIMKKYLSGVRIQELACEHGVSRQRIDQILNSLGIESEDRESIIDRMGLRSKIKEMCHAAYTQKQIAKELGIGIGIIKAIVKEDDLPVSHTSKRALYLRKYNVDGIINDYKSGMAIKDIAIKHGLHLSTFHKIKRCFLVKEEIRQSGQYDRSSN